MNTCGAKTKKDGSPCKRRPMPGKNRCKLHGGASTGPKNPRITTGLHTKEAIALRKRNRELIQQAKDLLRTI